VGPSIFANKLKKTMSRGARDTVILAVQCIFAIALTGCLLAGAIALGLALAIVAFAKPVLMD